MKTIIVGREKESCDYVVDDPFVSRIHVQIIQNEAGEFFVFDLESKTGTFVNGKKIIKETKIQSDDIIKIGNYVLKWTDYFNPSFSSSNDTSESQEVYENNHIDSSIKTQEYATFITRLLAFIIDILLIFILLFIVDFIIFLNDQNSYDLVSGVNIILVWLYYAISESSVKQATFGKRALNIKVTDMEGNRISFGNATGRYFAKIISALIIYIGYLMPLWTEKRQALHDIIAGCIVVKADK